MVLSKELHEAIQEGELTTEQIRELLTLEAEQVGWTLDEAVAWARSGEAPEDPLQADIRLLVSFLEVTSVAA